MKQSQILLLYIILVTSYIGSLSDSISTEWIFQFDLLNKTDWDNYRVTKTNGTSVNGESNGCTHRIPEIFKKICVDWNHIDGYKLSFKSSLNHNLDPHYNDLLWYYEDRETAKNAEKVSKAKFKYLNDKELWYNTDKNWTQIIPAQPRRSLINHYKEFGRKCYLYRGSKLCGYINPNNNHFMTVSVTINDAMRSSQNYYEDYDYYDDSDYYDDDDADDDDYYDDADDDDYYDVWPGSSVWNWIKKKAGYGTSTYQIFLTFDDGPSVGTEDVLNNLKDKSVKASFFVNGYRIGEKEQEGAGNVKKREGYVDRIIKEGHVLANHGYLHNYEFGTPDAAVANFVKNANADFYKTKGGLNRINSMGRLPGSNTWRVGAVTKDVKTRGYSTKNTADKLKAKGYKLYGWDVEWFITDTIANGKKKNGHGLKQTPQAMADEIVKALKNGATKTPNKVIMLAHDRQFAASNGHGSKLKEMIHILAGALSKATFHTLDNY